MRAGDILVLVNGEYVVVEWVQHEILESPVKVYNFQVADYHTYYVSGAGVLVHNLCLRSDLASLTGESGAGLQAHHVFPQAYRSFFESFGINIDLGKYGVWLEGGFHQGFSWEYNQDWFAFIDASRTNPVTFEEVLAFARMLAEKYGYQVNF